MVELQLKSPPNNLVAVTGISRSGKSMLAPIVSSLNRSENLQTDYTLEQFPVLNHLGLMSEHIAIYLMRYMVNFKIYDNQIGRNSNFRFTDWTSIWNTSDPRQYLRRLIKEEGDSVFENIKEENQINVYMFHNVLWHANIFFKAFPDIKIIHIDRHPIDMVYSWYKRGYGDRFYDKERSALALIKNGGNGIPYYAQNWLNEYISLTEIDRVIKMIYTITSDHYDTLKTLSDSDRKNILLINFDKIISNPKIDLKKICDILNTSKSSYTISVMERERCPRAINKIERSKKYEEIKNIASSESIKFMEEINKDFEIKATL